jgi:hypothetical protein
VLVVPRGGQFSQGGYSVQEWRGWFWVLGFRLVGLYGNGFFYGSWDGFGGGGSLMIEGLIGCVLGAGLV